jgi:hypothetical protein
MDIKLEVRGGKLLELAASAGASVFPADGATYEALLADADHRMYRDKAARRGAMSPPRTAPYDFLAAELFDGRTRTARSIPLPQTTTA